MQELKTLIAAYPVLAPLEGALTEAFRLLLECAKRGGKILICGNGGSAADGEHIVGELMKNFCRQRPISPEAAAKIRQRDEHPEELLRGLQGAIPAICLSAHTALLTALCNDGDPDMAYAQQVYGYGREGDALIALSTSGNAQNVVNAARVAGALGMKVVFIGGKNGGNLRNLADAALCLPETETYKIQELTLPIYHALCLALETALFA